MNIIAFPRPYMGVPGIGKTAVDYSDCDAGSPAWQERLARAIARYGPPCADCNEVELVIMLDEAEIEDEAAANRAKSEAARVEMAAKIAAAHDARMALYARPIESLSGRELWDEYGEFQSEFQDQGGTTEPARYRAVDAEIERRLVAFDGEAGQ